MGMDGHVLSMSYHLSLSANNGAANRRHGEEKMKAAWGEGETEELCASKCMRGMMCGHFVFFLLFLLCYCL